MNKNTMIKGVNELVNEKHKYDHMANALNPYCYGNACRRILKILSTKERFIRL